MEGQVGRRATQRVNRYILGRYIQGRDKGQATGRGDECMGLLQEGCELGRSPGIAHGFIRGAQLGLRGWGYPRAIGSDWTQLVSESPAHSILGIAECGVVQAPSQRRPTPGHSWQSPPCRVSSTEDVS